MSGCKTNENKNVAHKTSRGHTGAKSYLQLLWLNSKYHLHIAFTLNSNCARIAKYSEVREFRSAANSPERWRFSARYANKPGKFLRRFRLDKLAASCTLRGWQKWQEEMSTPVTKLTRKSQVYNLSLLYDLADYATTLSFTHSINWINWL